MKITVTKFDEENNHCELEVDDEGKQFLLEKGFNAMLMDYVNTLIEKNEEQ